MSSVWLHLGAFGPRRIVTTDAAATPPAPYKLTDNAYCLLDRTDLVFIDPVGTGFSQGAAGPQDKEFWGVDQDVKVFAEFILGYLQTHNRWKSPKFLIGESYGAFRSAALAKHLHSQDGVQINGIVMISPVLDLSTLSASNPSQDLPYTLSLPTYAAVAWYYKQVTDPPADLDTFLTQARQFASGEYATALSKGWRLTDREKSSVVKTLSHFTGLKEEYLAQANLRVSPPQFAAELESEKALKIGAYDARFSSPQDNLPDESISDDSTYSAIDGAFTSAINTYLRDELKVDGNAQYKVLSAEATADWDWKRSTSSPIPVSPNATEDLTKAMADNPYLQVQIEYGYFDLIAPFHAGEYTVDHILLPPNSASKMIHEKYYEAGHMMYLREGELAKLRENVASLIDAASSQ
jgi:carboxypeptidase C (cathepsin A)